MRSGAALVALVLGGCHGTPGPAAVPQGELVAFYPQFDAAACPADEYPGSALAHVEGGRHRLEWRYHGKHICEPEQAEVYDPTNLGFVRGFAQMMLTRSGHALCQDLFAKQPLAQALARVPPATPDAAAAVLWSRTAGAPLTPPADLVAEAEASRGQLGFAGLVTRVSWQRSEPSATGAADERATGPRTCTRLDGAGAGTRATITLYRHLCLARGLEASRLGGLPASVAQHLVVAHALGHLLDALAGGAAAPGAERRADLYAAPFGACLARIYARDSLVAPPDAPPLEAAERQARGCLYLDWRRTAATISRAAAGSPGAVPAPAPADLVAPGSPLPDCPPCIDCDRDTGLEPPGQD